MAGLRIQGESINASYRKAVELKRRHVSGRKIHTSKQVWWTLFPHAALQYTISSVSGSKSMKQIGQLPSIALRVDFGSLSLEPEAEAKAEDGSGAAAKISWSSCDRKAS